MRVDVDSVKFEDALDFLDYFGKGLPPKKKEAEKAFEELATLTDDVDDLLEDFDDEEDTAVFKPRRYTMTNDEYQEILHRIYENNIKNTKTWIGVSIGAGILGVLFGALFINTPEKEDKKKY